MMWALASLSTGVNATPHSKSIALFARDNLTPDQRAANAGSALSNQGGLQIWFNIGATIRNAMRRGATTVPVINPDTGKFAIDIKAVLMFYIPVLVFLVIVLLLLVGTGCTACCLCCCCKRKLLRKKAPYTAVERSLALIMLVLLIACAAVGILAGWLGSALISNGVGLAFTVVNTTMADVQLKLNGLQPAVNAILGNVGTIVNNSIDGLVTCLALDTFTGNAHPTLQGLATNLIALQASIDALLWNVTRLSNDYGNLTTVLQPALASDMNAYTNQLSALSANPYTNPNNNDQYHLNSALPAPDTSQMGGNFSGVKPSTTDLSDMIAPARSLPNLATLASDIVTLFNNLTTIASSTIASQTEPIKGKIGTTLNSAKSQLNDSLNPITIDFNAKIDDYRVAYVEKYRPMAVQYDGYRHYGYMSIFGLCIIWVLVPSLCILAKKPKGTKCCMLFSVVLILVLYLLSLLHFIFAYGLGEVCYYVFAQNASVAAAVVDNSTYQYIQYGFQGRSMCSQGNNMLQVAVALNVSPPVDGMTLNATTIDLRYQAQRLLDQANLNQLVSGVNLNSSISLGSNNLTNEIAPVSSNLKNITDMNLTDWRNRATQPVLGSQWQTFTSALTNVHNTANSAPPAGRALFTWTTGTAYDADVAYWASQFNPTYDSIIVYNSTSPTIAGLEFYKADSIMVLDGIQGSASPLNNSINALLIYNDQMKALVDNYLASVPTLLSNGVNILQTNILNGADVIQSQVNDVAECATLANDTLVLEKTVCTVVVGAFDSLWMAFLTLGICGTASLAVFTVAANRLADPTARAEAKETDPTALKKKFDDEDAEAANPANASISKRSSGRGIDTRRSSINHNVLATAEASPVSAQGQTIRNRSSSNSFKMIEPMSAGILEFDAESVLIPPGSRIATPDVLKVGDGFNGGVTDLAMESHSFFLASMAARAYNNGGGQDANNSSNALVMEAIDEDSPSGMYPSIDLTPSRYQEPSEPDSHEKQLDEALNNLISNLDAGRTSPTQKSNNPRASSTVRSHSTRRASSTGRSVSRQTSKADNLELDLTRLIARQSTTSSPSSPAGGGAPSSGSKPGYVAPPSLPANFTISGLPNETIRVVAASSSAAPLGLSASTFTAPLSRNPSISHQDSAAAYLEAKRTSRRASKGSRP
ncbi:hypothetical protein SeLEV6574_g01048 [Synchytrium endobioticum]|nr:hypothetical protein SeLEV6574_g01048 [Synchytrium endobioticum]